MIIALPKSASTSLMRSIAKALKIKDQNGISRVKDNPELRCDDFSEMQKFYGTTSKRTLEFLRLWIGRRDVIYKEHLLPTKEHIEYVRKISKPVIILTRFPTDSIDNHKRTVQAYHDGKLTAKEKRGLVIEEMILLDMDKLQADFEAFNDGWINAKLPNALYITFEELVLYPHVTLKKVLNHLGYKTKYRVLSLLKAKGNRGDYNTYTGVGEKRLKEKLNGRNA